MPKCRELAVRRTATVASNRDQQGTLTHGPAKQGQARSRNGGVLRLRTRTCAYHATTLEQIAARAGVAVQTVYFHFGKRARLPGDSLRHQLNPK
jgi:hypothetical protein